MPAATPSTNYSHLTGPFLSTLRAAAQANSKYDPRYYTTTPHSLLSDSTIHSFATGTGDAIYTSIAPLLESTNQELILVTCFWAQSSTLETLNDALRKLSNKATQRGSEKIRVRLCFSSLSIFQKLFHKQSVTGQTYDSSVWQKKLGLPPPSALGGLDLRIKSVFILPFSVMHPKFMIIDRKTVLLPSCNISWEEWFEGCITMSGPIVSQFLQFYSVFWERKKAWQQEVDAPDPAAYTLTDNWNVERRDHERGHVISQFVSNPDPRAIKYIPTIFLPSPHRRNPQFQFFTSQERILAPPTPLNAFILTVLEKAETSVWIQTPNITSPPVLSAILKALARGIDVRILTSERLMILEQLVTAGTTTARCVKKLVKRYKDLHSIRSLGDEEAAISAPLPGRLQISYFSPIGGLKPRGQERGEPQQSHLKMTVIDNEVLVLGSGNLDRASWFTSQELGVAFFDEELAGRVIETVDTAMQGRSKIIFDSQVPFYMR